MIKNPKKFLKENEKAHKDFLKHLTYRKSIKITEAMLSSKLVKELSFSKNSSPTSLEKMIRTRQRCRDLR